MRVDHTHAVMTCAIGSQESANLSIGKTILVRPGPRASLGSNSRSLCRFAADRDAWILIRFPVPDILDLEDKLSVRSKVGTSLSYSHLKVITKDDVNNSHINKLRSKSSNFMLNHHFSKIKGKTAKGKGQRAEGKGQRAKGKGQRAKGKGQRAKGKVQRAEGKEQRAKSQGQRAKGKGQRAKGSGSSEDRSFFFPPY